MPDIKQTRYRILGAIAAVWVIGAIAIFAFLAATRPEPVTVVHWTNGHLLRDGSGMRLLRQMADEFNRAGYQTQSGNPSRSRCTTTARRIKPKTSYPEPPVGRPWIGNVPTPP